LYLAIVLDLFSRMVVGWSMAAIQDAMLAFASTSNGLGSSPSGTAGLLHHSDRGSIYTSESYQAILQQEGIDVSMSRTGNCYDNAPWRAFSIASKGNALTVNVFKREHRPSWPRLSILSASIIGLVGTPL
jgi:putative transposase